MFDFSFLEMLVVFVVALLVLGPERLPKVARQVGWWVGKVRASVSNMRDELERETSMKDFRAATQDIEQSIGDTVRSTRSTVEAAAQSAAQPTAESAGEPAAAEAVAPAPPADPAAAADAREEASR